MKTDRGFSLLELLIVVGIILIIATIAIPTLLRSRQAANESAAVADLRTINTSEANYLLSSDGNYGAMSDLVSAGLIDAQFNSVVSGYSFTISNSGTNYTGSAYPTSTNSGRYGYYTLPDNVIRYDNASGAANCTPCYPTGLSGNGVD